MRQTTIDLEEGVSDIQEKITETEKTKEEFKKVLQEEYDSFYDIPPSIEDKWEQLNEELKNLIGQKRALKRVTDDNEEESWGGSEITISELSGGQLAKIQDDVDSSAVKSGMAGQDVNGARVIAFLQESVITVPPEAPSNPKDWPWLLMLYVFDKVNNFNTVGETDFQQESLKEAMEKD